MFSSVSIRNFRCFENLKIEGLRRINLFAGANNAGKTSLLEAMFLNMGGHNPEIPVRLSALRGVEKMSMNVDEVWGWLFYKRQINREIQIEAVDESGETQSLKISVGAPKDSQMDLPVSGDSGSSSSAALFATAGRKDTSSALRASHDLSELNLTFQTLGGVRSVSRAFFGPEGEIKIELGKANTARPGSFQSTRARNKRENADQFTRLRIAGRHQQLVVALKQVDARIQGLEILSLGGEPVIHAEIGLGQPVPLPFLGEGINRILSVLLAVADTAGGVVMIDEIENGIFFGALGNLWAALQEIAEASDVQIFATTHSRECVMAAHNAAKERGKDELSVQRLQLVKGQVEAVHLGDEHLELASEMGLEVRA